MVQGGIVMDKEMIILDIIMSIIFMAIPTTLCIIGEVGLGILLYIMVLSGIIADIIIEFSE